MNLPLGGRIIDFGCGTTEVAVGTLDQIQVFTIADGKQVYNAGVKNLGSFTPQFDDKGECVSIAFHCSSPMDQDGPMTVCKVLDIKGSRFLLSKNLDKAGRVHMIRGSTVVVNDCTWYTQVSIHEDSNFLPTVTRNLGLRQSNKDGVSDYFSATNSVVTWKPSSGTLKFEQADTGLSCNFDLYYSVLGKSDDQRFNEVRCFDGHLICRISWDRYALVEL